MARNEKEEVGALVKSAVEDGFSRIAKANSNLPLEYLNRHLDHDKLNGALKRAYKEIEEEKGNLTCAAKAKRVHDYISASVADGSVFDQRGQSILLKDERGRGRVLDKLLKGPSPTKDFRDAAHAFKDLYSMFKTGEYSHNLEDVAQAVAVVNDMGFLDTAVDVLRSYNLMDKNRYSTIKKSLRKKGQDAANYTLDRIENYGEEMKQAASILALFGASILAVSAFKMTGNVVSASLTLPNNLLGMVLGLGFFIGGFVMFSKFSQHDKNLISKRTKKNTKKR